MGYKTGNEALESRIPKHKPFGNFLNHYQEIMTRNEHVYVICCRPEVDDNVISGRNVKIIKGFL